MIFSDFYAGAGGWSVGLGLSGLKSVYSAEIWPVANKTREWNLGTSEQIVDIRKMTSDMVPDCDLIVGSPPCTQFSYANKGGNGDIQDGMKDIIAFLNIVKNKKPKYWVMENVPRLADILRNEITENGVLYEFADLFSSIDVFDMSDWGVPQRRKRCIAGNYPRDILLSLKGQKVASTLSDIVDGCKTGVDPIWGQTHTVVSDNIPDSILSWEEARINKEKKRNHPIYNDMAFPDLPNMTARTVTATCTKVSRESIVVPYNDQYRLLTPREMAAIQSFPLNYQFASNSPNDRIKMAGNAIPPLFTYFIGLAIQGIDKLPFVLPTYMPFKGEYVYSDKKPQKSIKKKENRSFRASVSKLRFKSGMSFEVNNSNGIWKMIFNTGIGIGSGSIESLSVDNISKIASSFVSQYFDLLPNVRSINIQHAWSNSLDNNDHPFKIIDLLEDAIDQVELSYSDQLNILGSIYETMAAEIPAKALYNMELISKGIILSAVFNEKYKV